MSVPPAPPPGEPPPGDVYGAPTRVARPGYAEQVVYEDPAAVDLRWQRAFDSLRTMIAIVAVIALAGLGVGIWALVREHNDRSNAGNRAGLATQADVAALNGRINRLSRAVNAARGAAGAGAGSAAALSGRIAALQSQVKGLQSANLSQQVGTLSGQVQKLQGEVAQLKAAQQSGSSTTTTQTTTTPGG